MKLKFMKTLTFMLGMMMGISFAACSDDDDNNFDERPEVTEGQYLFTMPVNTGDGGSVECKAYVDGNELHFINLFGTTARVVYTLDESGNISSNLSDQKSLSINSTSGVVSDHVNLKGVAQQYDISFVWPSYEIEYFYAYADDLVRHYGTEKVIIVGSKVMFPKFLGSGNELIVDCNIDTRATDNMGEGGNVAGPYSLPDDATIQNIYFYPNSGAAKTFNYIDFYEDGTHYKFLDTSTYLDDKYGWIRFALPDNFEPQDDFKGISANATVHVDVYDTEDTSLPTTETTPQLSLDLKAIATDKNSITLVDIFDVRYLTYTIAADNTLDTNWIGWIATNFYYKGTKEGWVYFNKGEHYMSFDPTNAVITHSVWLSACGPVCLKVQLPDSYKR
jgi:hypothetical protein